MRLEQHTSYGDFAILYRTNAQSRIFEEALRKKNIPYRIYGGLSFYQRKEIKDIISYFRMIVNPSDEEAFRRIINYPARGIGDVTVQKITSAAQRHQLSLWEIVSNPLKYNLDVNSGTGKKISGFTEMISGFLEKNKTENAFDVAQAVIKESGIAKESYEDMTPEGMSRAQNVQELLNGINEFVNSRIEQGIEEVSLVDFLSEVSLLTDQDTDKESSEEKVTMMTIHASKGLEFKHVFVVGMEEDLFPSGMAKNEPRGLEEERRLFYVAITRAEETCTLTFAKSRFKNGSINVSRESRFLSEIDPGLLSMERNTLSATKPDAANGFWETMRSAYNESVQKRPATRFSAPKRMTSVENTSSSPAKLSAEATELQVGNIIEHERFGRGEVVEIEQSGNDKRAFVEFELAGRKQLLLKFAKFKIVK